MLSMLFETGHPWITFKDPCNVRSPQDHVGVIHSSNLCTEITLNTSNDETAVCNLGSVILETHLLPDGAIDHDKLRETIRMAVRALDNVIDINFYPTPAAEDVEPPPPPNRPRRDGPGARALSPRPRLRLATKPSSSTTRRWKRSRTTPTKPLPTSRPNAAPIRATRVRSGTAVCFRRTRSISSRRNAVSRSKSRAAARWTGRLCARRSRSRACAIPTVLAIAPTATISNITATSPCIEPTYKNLFVKSNLSGEFIVLNPFLVKDLKARGLWNQEMIDNLKYFDGELKDIASVPADLKAKYLTAFDIDFKWITGRRRPPPEMDRPGPVREPLDQDARSEDPEPHVSVSLARRPQDDVLSPQSWAPRISRKPRSP